MKKILLLVAILLAFVAAPASAQVTVCLDTFCDTLQCGLDNGDNISCLWDWTCDGSDNEEMLGELHGGGGIEVAGLLQAIGLTESWDMDGATRTVDIWIWNGVGFTTLLASDTWSTSCAAEDQVGKPAVNSAGNPRFDR